MIGVIQHNPIVGDVAYNTDEIIKKKSNLNTELAITPELATTGCPPRDLLYSGEFVQAVENANIKIARECSRYLVLGTITTYQGNLYNTILICHNGEIIKKYYKNKLATKPYFDERKYFAAGRKSLSFDLEENKFGVIFYDELEDIENFKYGEITDLIVLSCNPYFVDYDRRQVITRISKKYGYNIFLSNMVGGQDQLVFEGHSMMVDRTGEVCYQAAGFKPVAEPIKEGKIEKLSQNENLLHCLVTGIKDYVLKNGFQKVIVGISGGIDSALTITLGTLSLGPQNVIGVLLPGPFSSNKGKEDAAQLAKNLNVETVNVDIQPIYQSYLKSLEPIFGKETFGVTEENIQARIRGNLLMALANKYDHLVLSTGNRSESAVGYATLYGDLAGGFAPISDLYKRDVFSLAEYINRKFKKEIIPQSIIDKVPSAELRPDQKDEDDLPSYHLLDPILDLLLDKNLDPDEIVKKGFDKKIVYKITKMVYRSEFKRTQSPVGIKIHKRTFANGISMPVTMRWI